MLISLRCRVCSGGSAVNSAFTMGCALDSISSTSSCTGSLLMPMVEEALRWDPPIQCTYRRATQDDRIEGVEVKAGEMVIPMWAGANWDPEVFPNPEQFDIDRPTTKPHMGFGFGPHFCAGAELARLEAKIAFEELLRRLGDIKLDEAESDLSHLPSFASHGYQKIGLSFTRVD